MWRDDRMCSADWGEIELINKADGQWFCWVHLRFRLSEEWSTSPERLYSLWRWSSGKGRGEGSRRALNWSRTKVGCGEYTQDLARRASVSGCLSGAVCQHRRLYKQKPRPKTIPTLCTSPLPVSWCNWLKWKIHIIKPRLVQTKSWFVFLTCSNLLVLTFFLRVYALRPPLFAALLLTTHRWSLKGTGEYAWRWWWSAISCLSATLRQIKGY